MNAAQSHCLVSTWENSRTEEEACGSQTRPSVRRRNVTVVYITGGTTHTSAKANRGRARWTTAFLKVEQPGVTSLWHFQTFYKFSPSLPVHRKNPFFLPFAASVHLFHHLSIHPSCPPFLHRLSFLSPAPPFSSPCLHQPSTMAIMTHLPVKLLPVETARPWHRTQCLSASLLRSPKSQVDIILTATGITPPYNASIFSRSLELKAPKQWAPIDRKRPKVNSSGSLGVRLRNKYGPAAHLFLDLLKCSERWLSILWDEKTAAFSVWFVPEILGATVPSQPFRQTH